MAFTKPKRFEELSPLDSELNFQTPLRSSFPESTSKKSFFPKRISELSPLESSDEEDGNSHNKAILNYDSFSEFDSENNQNIINDKVKAEEFDVPPKKLPSISETNEITSSEIGHKRDSTASRQLHFRNVSANAFVSEKERPTISLFSKIQSNNSVTKTTTQDALIVARNGTFPTQSKPIEDKLMDTLDVHRDESSGQRAALTSVKTVLFDEKHQFTGKTNSIDDRTGSTELCTPKVTSKSDESNNRSTMEIDAFDTKSVSHTDLKDETPYKTFQMPMVMRKPQSTHRRLLSSSSNLNKFRSAMENEFRSQKVLFTTPSAVSRPTIQLMSNLGLDDSLNCYKSSPITTNPVPNPLPVIEDRNERVVRKQTKTSTNDIMMNSMDKVDSISSVATGDPKKKIVEQPKGCCLTSDDGGKGTENEKKTIRINGKDFVIQKKIGQGGSSSVFLAEHKDSKLECALKVVDLRGDPALIEGYVKEVKILAMLQDKVNVIRLFEYALVSSENLLYMVMEKGDSDLRKILQAYKTPLPLYTLMNLWHQMLQSVNYIHKNDVIHSDLKPENFLMVRGRLKLIDFGISSKIAVDATSIIKYSQVGTFNYISPEALMDTSTGSSPMTKKTQPKIRISTKSDVWSLGCILYLLLYKKTPFAHIKNVYAKMQAIIDPNKLIEYESMPNYYPTMLVEMVQMCLKHNPKERATVADLLNFPFDMVIPIEK